MPINYTKKQEWPPKPFDYVLEDMRTWSAWYSGDADELADIYANKKIYNKRRVTSKALHRSPLGGNDDVFFWGRTNGQDTKRRHHPMPATLAKASSNLLFSKPPRITPGDNDLQDERLVNRVEKIFGVEAFAPELSEAAELSFVLGGTYLRPWWDTEVCDHVVPSHVPADAAIPEFRFNRLTAVTFFNIVSEAGETPILRHLERHEKGAIYHALFSGDSTTLGERIDLDAHPATRWVTEVADETGKIDTGLEELDVVYIPEARPARSWRNIAGLGGLGRSGYEGIESEFDTLDEVQTSWLRDIEDGKSRVFIDENLLEDFGPGRGGGFDQDKHLYVKTTGGFGSAAEASGQQIETVKFDIRWQEHAQTIAEIKSGILEFAGMSAQHMTDGPLAVGVSATEINARSSVSESTRGGKVNYWRAGIAQFVDIVMKLDAIHFNTGLQLTEPPKVRFIPQAYLSKTDEASMLSTSRQANILSQEQAIRERNPEWTEKQVDEELERIKQDQLWETKLSFGQGLDASDVDLETNEGETAEEQLADMAESAGETEGEGEHEVEQ